MTQSPHGRMTRGRDPACCGLDSRRSRRGVHSASQNKEGQQSCHRAPSRPTAGHSPCPSHLGLCLPTSRLLVAPAHGRLPPLHPLSIHLQAARKQTCPRPLHARLENHRPPTGRFTGKVMGFIKPWSSAGSGKRISNLHEGPWGPCLPFISLSRGSPKASTWLTHLFRIYGRGWRVVVGAVPLPGRGSPGSTRESPSPAGAELPLHVCSSPSRSKGGDSSKDVSCRPGRRGPCPALFRLAVRGRARSPPSSVWGVSV